MFLIVEADAKLESRQPFFLVDDVLLYNSLEQLVETVSKIPKKEKASKDAVEMTLEEEVENLIPEKEAEIPQLRYSFFEEQFLMEQAYHAPALSYEKLRYKEGTLSLFESEEKYETSEMVSPEAETEILSSEEAKEIMVNIQYAAITGAIHEVNSEQRQKISLMAMLDPSLFKLLEATSALSRDVDYRPFA